MEGTGQGEQDFKVKPIKIETGVVKEYGEGTWKPSQSVVDVVQNHLDANTSIYEKQLLQILGITEYKPSDPEQQNIVSSLNLLKYAQTPEAIAKAQAGIQTILGESAFDPEAIKVELEEVAYQLPDMKLKVSNGSETKYVDYDKMKDLDQLWEVTGFLVDDQGSGFDNQLLGIIGGSTKADSKGKRGGLGEGLKMSLTHLLRSGATTHLVSRNANELWTADPQGDNGTINFQGIAISGEGAQQQGSTTEIDFSNETINPKFREELVNTLDPRKGEGLGKYILDFRGKEFFPIITNGSTELESLDVPGGRIYVRGLLVQESEDTLWSYNISDKWAIGGRDRKTVKPDMLKSTVHNAIASLDDLEQIKTIIRLTSTYNRYLETKQITEDLPLDEQQKSTWQQAVAEVFNFIPGVTLFAPGNISTAQERFATERKHTIIRIPPENIKAVNFFKTLYPDHKIAFDQLEGWHGDSEIKNTSTPEIPLDPNSEMIAQKCKEIFYQLVNPNKKKFRSTLKRILGKKEQDLHLPSFDSSKLKTVRFIQAPPLTKFESDDTQFVYDAQKNLIYVRGEIPNQNFAVMTDISTQLLKSLTGKAVFDLYSQDILTVLAGHAVSSLRPDLLPELQLTHSKAKITIEKSITYPQEAREKDERDIEFRKTVEKINTPNITKDELLQSLEEIKRVDPPENPMYGTNSCFYFDGKIYILKDLTLTEELSVPILNPDEDEHHIHAKENTYLPYQLEDGESIELQYLEGNDEKSVVIKRRGGHIIIKEYGNDKNETYIKKNEFDYYNKIGQWTIFNNVILLKSLKDFTLHVDKKPNNASEELTEINRGDEFLEANITLDYGKDVWQDPKRILLDAIQNHIDAKNDAIPEITYTIVDQHGNVQQVTKEALEIHNSEWKIIGMTIKDEGQGYPTPYLTMLGKSTKSDEDLGSFGEGLKMLSAAALRQGISVTFKSRDWQANPTSYTKTVKNHETNSDETFRMLGYDLTWAAQPQRGSQTHFSLLPHSSNIRQLTQAQLTELTDLTNEKNKIWQTWVEVLDPRIADKYGRRGLARYVLPKDERPHTDGIVTLLTDRTENIYEKGLLIPGVRDQQRIFGYNIDETIIDTRERNTFDEALLDTYVSKYFSQLTDTQVMKQILEAAKKNPNVNYYEYKFLLPWRFSLKSATLWRQTYYEVFGNDAILSLQPVLDAYINKRTMMTLEKNDEENYEYLLQAVDSERHLEIDNLQRLPIQVTSLLDGVNVYTSRDFNKVLKGTDIELPEDDKEKLTEFIRATNQLLLTILESIDSTADGRAYLDTITRPDQQDSPKASQLGVRKAELQAIAADDIHVKHKSFAADGSVKLGVGRPIVSLNQKILGDHQRTVDTLVHEASHYLSNQKDYELKFQQFMMATVMARLADSTHNS